jgi:DNA-binding GntR family transcriptional regulator
MIPAVTDWNDGAPTFKAAIYARMANMIRELELPPGSRLVEADLAERLSVSKTPIREALLLLERDGLVELIPHTGATVTWPSIIEYEDVQRVLDAVEQPSLGTIAERMTVKDHEVLDRLLQRIRKARADRDSRRYFAAMFETHKTMFAAARSAWLSYVVEATLLHARRYERIFIHQFDDAWDIELATFEERLAYVRSGEATRAAEAVAKGHAATLQLFRERANDPKVARYLRPAASVAERPPATRNLGKPARGPNRRLVPAGTARNRGQITGPRRPA